MSPLKNSSSDIQKYIRDDVQRRAGENFKVTFNQVSQIPANPAGKRRLVINELTA